MKRKLLFVVNVDWFFLSHRLPIALEAKKQGYEVHVAAGTSDKVAELQSYGFILHPLSIARGRVFPHREVRAFFQILRLFRKLRPDVVHLVTIKPVLFGGIAARMTAVPAVVAAISGLGFVYVGKGIRVLLERFIAGCLYRLALGRDNIRVIFQNSSDKDTLSNSVGLSPEKSILLYGSGIDLTAFRPSDFPPGAPVVVMACRLISSKGVWEFIEAARLVRAQGVDVRFRLAGSMDSHNPESLTENDLARIRAEGLVELLGKRDDMEQVLAEAHIVALPSYYGEGLPKVLVEAAACGRAVITTDMPGCRDAIVPGVTGIIVPPRDAKALSEAIIQLVRDPERCSAMGKAGRMLAEKQFDIREIVAAHMHIYRELLQNATQ
jgi:glycosyltransferase involved in cell wall biosynthesis